MFEYIIFMPSPLKPKGSKSDEIEWMVVAQYNFDPGLQVGDEVDLSKHFGRWEDKPFLFKAQVVKKNKIVICQKGGDIFRIAVFVELADKEDLTRMRKILRDLNPEKFED